MVNGEQVKQAAREIANGVATFLRQEYQLVDGEWWLFSLGRPRRPLTDIEIKEAQKRGQIPLEEET